MFVSPVPLMVIRADVDALIEVNGEQLGACESGSFVTLPVGDSGDYFICAVPLCGFRYPVTRRLRLENGSLAMAPPDLSVCVWPGGVFELSIHTGEYQTPRVFPTELDSMQHGEKRYTLFYDGGLKLSVEQRGAPLSTFSIGGGMSGSLALLTLKGKSFCAVRQPGALLLLDEALHTALDIAADEVTLEPAAIFELGTLMGHQRKVGYALNEDASGFLPLPPKTGFFTREYVYPNTPLRLATAFCEAVREGFFEEAATYLSKELSAGLSPAQLSDFMGRFQVVRPPMSDESGAILGLISQEGERLSSARLIGFEFEEGRISNMSEL